ncbi:protein phosphatase inhibitor 2 [Sabethes cyaneus]|uniref:protein phosphatase inhibitor 2 n=1 Tax=Sabethes cyaneus TaxID=53552 RepID=UPI00221E2DE3|nr:protein phosphatase inhibitor 2 [Sabethes cyaneus]XP_053684064.1 protein phosphatase inhibitor 2 [Sabethes cyaneus]
MSLNTDSPDAKKPCKGILKSSSSFDKHTTAPVASSSNHRKSAKFDELNVLQTYHPADKDYGHMKVDEPKTPFNYVEELDLDQLDAELLAEKLREAVNSRSDSVSEEEAESSEEEEEELSEEQKKRKLDFERRRKAHYNEFEAIKLARKLIEEEHEDDDDDDEDDASLAQAAAAAAVNSSSKSSDGQKMEVEEHDEVDRKKDEPAAGSSRSAATTTTGTESIPADEV